MKFIKYDSDRDGVDHINVYSGGKTELGRFLSNFSYYPIMTEDGHFDSIEGYWYWLSCRDDRLRKVSGYRAKQLGRALLGLDWFDSEEFKSKICKAIGLKLCSSKYIDEFKMSSLPFTHYYCYGARIIDVPDSHWILKYLEDLRARLKYSNLSDNNRP